MPLLDVQLPLLLLLRVGVEAWLLLLSLLLLLLLRGGKVGMGGRVT